MRNVRLPLIFAALVVTTALFASACEPQTTVSHNKTPIRGYPELNAHQMAEFLSVQVWTNAVNGVGCGYNATVSALPLAMYFEDEGRAQYIRGDIAFAQSILETGWFGFCTGSVKGWHNNFAGIGATGHPDLATWCAPVPGASGPCKFSSAPVGIRAQMQRLNRYSNTAGATSLARALVPQRGWINATQYNNWSAYKGTVTTWQAMTGSWATSPCYDTRVMRLYNDMRAYHGLAKFPVTAKAGC